jgi:hypothetical protein
MEDQKDQKELFSFEKPKPQFFDLGGVFRKTGFEDKVSVTLGLEKLVFISIGLIMLMVVLLGLPLGDIERSQCALCVPWMKAPTEQWNDYLEPAAAQNSANTQKAVYAQVCGRDHLAGPVQ